MSQPSQAPLWHDSLDRSLQQSRLHPDVVGRNESARLDLLTSQTYESISPQAGISDSQPSPVASLHGPSVGLYGSRRFSAAFSSTPIETTSMPSHNVSDSFPSSLNDAAFDEFAIDPDYLASQEELRSMIFNTAQSSAPSRIGSPSPIITSSATQESANVMSNVINSKKRVLYLKNYIDVVARWLDMFDEERTFGVQLVSMAQQSPALLYAILGISARHIERKTRTSSSFDSLELYQESIRRLAPLLQICDSSVIATCVILCCLEMMSASAHDWRKHLEGCAALLDAFDINGLSGGLDQAVFWCYTRMDLSGALITDGTESTILKINRWLPSGTSDNNIKALFHAAGTPDMHANFAVYLCARTCHLLAQRTKYVELAEENDCNDEAFGSRWKWLWDELQAWFDDRPDSMRPLEACETKPFPRILFGHWAAISSNQLAHTATIMLLNSRPKAITLNETPGTSLTWHARRICAISATNQHEGCLNNALQPLWIAGLQLCERSEHISLVRLIRSIELLTGWGFSWRISDLSEAWGYTLDDVKSC